MSIIHWFKRDGSSERAGCGAEPARIVDVSFSLADVTCQDCLAAASARQPPSEEIKQALDELFARIEAPHLREIERLQSLVRMRDAGAAESEEQIEKLLEFWDEGLIELLGRVQAAESALNTAKASSRKSVDFCTYQLMQANLALGAAVYARHKKEKKS